MPYNPRYDRVSLSPVSRQVTNFCPAPHNAPPEAFELGRNIRNGRRCDKVGYNGENHIAILGKPGSGKDTSLLIPNLLRLRDRSIVAVDPKGEMAAVCAPVRARYGRVVVLNPFRLLCDLAGYDYMQGCGINLLCALDISSPEFSEDAGLLSEAHIPMASGEKQPFFPLTAREIVAFLIMVECVKAKEQGRDPYLFNVRRMLCEEIAEGEPPSKALPYGTPAKGIPAYAREMVNSPIMALRNKAGQFCTWSKGLSDAVATARTETAFLDDARMAYFLSQNDFDFRELRERVTSVFLVVPMKQMKRHGKFLRMALTAALNACQRPRAADEPRTVVVLNEYYSLGHLQIIEDNYTVVRGSGIQIILSLHSIGQLKQLHDKNWETMLGSTDAICAFAPNDTETADWISKRSGEVGKFKVTVTQNYNRNSGNSQSQGTSPTGETGNAGTSGGASNGWTANYSYEKLPALTTYDLYSMQKGEMRIIAANTGDTMHVHALPYFAMPKLLAETRPPLNPYAPGVDIPRIRRQEPDYEGFIRQRFGAVPLIQEINTSTWGDAPDWREPPAPKLSSPAGNDYLDNRMGDDLPKADPGRNFFSGLKSSTGASNAPQGNSSGMNKSGGDDWHAPRVERPAQAEPKPQAAPAQASLWLNPSAYVDRTGRGATAAAGSNRSPPSPSVPGNSTVNINVAFVNSGSGTMNVNFGNGAVQGNSAVYQPGASTRTPSPAPAPAPENRQKAGYWQEADWQKVSPDDLSIPALPAAPARPLALPAPQRGRMQPQPLDSISGGVQARHPAFTPDPARTLANYAVWRTKPTPDLTESPKPKRGRRKRQ